MKAIFAVILLVLFSGSTFAAEQYIIKSGDTLDVIVAGDQGMSKKTVVRPDGKIAIALIGDVKAAGLTPQQLSANLQKALLKYMKRPSVSVEVTGYETAAAINVLGGVHQPGQFPLKGKMTLMDALALAGGTTDRAKLNEVAIIRQSAQGTQKLTVDLAKVINTGKSKDSLYLQPGDSVVVPEKKRHPDWLRIIGAAVSVGYFVSR